MKKIILIFLCLFSISMISASANVAYIVTSQFTINQDFITTLNEIDLTHNIIYASNVSNIDFSSYDLILLNNENFLNSKEIPINEYPSLMVNGRNMEDWGWCRYISKTEQNTPFKADILNLIHPIADSFVEKNIQLYGSNDVKLYSLNENNIYSGLKIIVSMENRPNDAIIAIAEEGDVLTYPGMPDTQVNANGVFFGISETAHWSTDTKQLFKNSIIWLLNGTTTTQFQIPLTKGDNLISFPLESNQTISELISQNPNLISIKEYFNGTIVDTTQIQNNKAYFIKLSENSTLTINGKKINSPQIQLNNGMNLVGISSLSNINLDSLPTEIIEVSKREGNEDYETATRYSFGWHNSFELEPGKGYWFKTNKEVTWNY